MSCNGVKSFKWPYLNNNNNYTIYFVWKTHEENKRINSVINHFKRMFIVTGTARCEQRHPAGGIWYHVT